LIAYGQQQTTLRWLSPADDFESVVVASAVVYFRGTLGYPDSIVPSTSVLLVPTPTPGVTVEPGRLADLARVPAGAFAMGSQPSDPFSESVERPQHAVQVSEFWIERTEVSNAAYAACVAAGGCTPPASASSSTRSAYYGSAAFDDYPVVNVTHGQAAAYCAWAGGRLPTEAEWEKAARGPETRYYPWGSERPNRTLANYGKIVNDTTAVDGYPAGASPYGLLNMGGNVWEWVADWYSATYYASSPPSDPPGPAAGQDRVVRGGSWGSDGQFLRTTNRFYHNPSNASPTVGFRCAATHEP
jgi:formylglycine-generating enzyme required for sulfatase activity